MTSPTRRPRFTEIDTHAVIGRLVLDTTESLRLWSDGLMKIEDMFDEGNGDEIEMTVENRGAVVRIGRRQRLTWTPPNGDPEVWFGINTREVYLRVWHDGSVSIEGQVDR